MMQYWNEIETDKFDKDNLKCVIDYTWEDIPIRDLFDDTVDDIEEIERKVDNCELYWIIVRARVFFNDIQIGSSSLGGILIENIHDILNDYYIDDIVDESYDMAYQFIEKVKEI